MVEEKSNYVLWLFILGVLANVGDALGLFQWALGQDHWALKYAIPAFIALLCVTGVCWVRMVQREAADERATLESTHKEAIAALENEQQETMLAMQQRQAGLDEEHRKRMAILADGLHSVTHKLRDHEHEIETKAQGDNFDKERLRDLSPQGGQKVVDALEFLLSELTGQRVHTCIRILEPLVGDKPRALSAEEANTVVFCRSAHSPRNRKRRNVQPVIDNTDFVKILLEKNDYYFGLDLDKKAERREYENSTNGWKDLYRSAVVVPIRLKISPEGSPNVKYDCLGFLCADSEDPKAFDPDLETFWTDTLMAAADALYLYLDFVLRLEERLAKDEKDREAKRLQAGE